MDDFVERLITPFKRGLKRLYDVTDVTVQIHTGHVCHDIDLPSNKAFKPKYPDKKYVEVFIHFPDEYVKKNEDWSFYASQGCVTVLDTLGLEAASADAYMDNQNRFVFWVPMNERIYQNLPPIAAIVEQKDFRVEGEFDQAEEARLIELARQECTTEKV